MDITEIVIALLSGTTLGGIVEAIRYRRQNKKLKENEVKVSDVETQREQINLAEDYMQKVMELSERTYQATLKNGTDNESIMSKIDEVVAEQRNIVAYLNGGYQEFKHNKEQHELDNRE